MRKEKTYFLKSPNLFKKKLIFFLKTKSRFCFLDSNGHFNKYSSFDYLAAFGVKKKCNPKKDFFKELKSFLDSNKDWVFGHFNYDLKNDIEELSSNNNDEIDFSKLNFFIPYYIFLVKKNTLTIIYDDVKRDIKDLFNQVLNQKTIFKNQLSASVRPTISKKTYLSKIESIKKNIQLGDIYEMNFCQEFQVDFNNIDPGELFLKLNDCAQAPFSAFYKLEGKYCICSSPERFIKKKSENIISQPIKGTARRHDLIKNDNKSKMSLEQSSKDFSENVMIVDLVRNDLSITAQKNSVQVEELAKVYSYKNVHHLVSTIISKIRTNTHPLDVIKHAFPMGSMTGAPKIKSMELIEKYENTLRGLYSGSIGYFDPNLDFDFNVVIRSLLYNEKSDYLSFIVGGAITIESEGDLEYEECLTKAQSIVKILGNGK